MQMLFDFDILWQDLAPHKCVPSSVHFLDVCQSFCTSVRHVVCFSYQFMRLDGSMSIKKRAKIVERFNDPSVSFYRLFVNPRK